MFVSLVSNDILFCSLRKPKGYIMAKYIVDSIIPKTFVALAIFCLQYFFKHNKFLISQRFENVQLNLDTTGIFITVFEIYFIKIVLMRKKARKYNSSLTSTKCLASKTVYMRLLFWLSKYFYLHVCPPIFYKFLLRGIMAKICPLATKPTECELFCLVI